MLKVFSEKKNVFNYVYFVKLDYKDGSYFEEQFLFFFRKKEEILLLERQE